MYLNSERYLGNTRRKLQKFEITVMLKTAILYPTTKEIYNFL